MSKEGLEPQRQLWETANYEDDPFELGAVDDSQLVIVKDFLPSPEKLMKNEKPPTARINMPVETDLLNWFKAEAKRVDGSYQRMIKNLMREYRDQIEETRAKNKDVRI